jgi:DNA-binding NtrC family response regulator
MKTTIDSNVLEDALQITSRTRSRVSRERQAQPRGSKINMRLVLLLTRDPNFEKLLAEALRKGGLSAVVTGSVDDALQTVCVRSGALEFAVIDFDNGCHGMTLLRAINACHRELPIIVVTSSDLDHAAALAYVHGAAVCLAKPITATEVDLVLSKLHQPKLQLTVA